MASVYATGRGGSATWVCRSLTAAAVRCTEGFGRLPAPRLERRFTRKAYLVLGNFSDTK
jgi:hypothetical protein